MAIYSSTAIEYDKNLSEGAAEYSKRTNTPCKGHESITSLFSDRNGKITGPEPSKLQYFKTDLWSVPLFANKGIATSTSESYQNIPTERRTDVINLHVGKPPPAPCFTKRKLGSANFRNLTKYKRDRPHTVHNNRDFYTQKKSFSSHAEVLTDFSNKKSYLHVYSFGPEGRTKLKNAVDNAPSTGVRYPPIKTFSKVDRNSPLNSTSTYMERPLKQEKGKYRYKSISVVNLPVQKENTGREKSSKSVDVYLKHLKLSTNAPMTSQNHFINHHSMYQRTWDTRLLEAVSKYNRPLWEDLISREITLSEPRKRDLPVL